MAAAKVNCEQYREAAGQVYALIQTIVCGRGLFEDFYIIPAKIKEVSFQMSWHAHAQEYFEKVSTSLKSILRSQGQTQVQLTIFRPCPHADEIVEQWSIDVNCQDTKEKAGTRNCDDDNLSIASNASYSLQTTVNQIEASASFMPVLTPRHLFKVSMAINSSLSIPSNSILQCQKVCLNQMAKPESLNIRDIDAQFHQIRVTCHFIDRDQPPAHEHDRDRDNIGN